MDKKKAEKIKSKDYYLFRYYNHNINMFNNSNSFTSERQFLFPCDLVPPNILNSLNELEDVDEGDCNLSTKESGDKPIIEFVEFMLNPNSSDDAMDDDNDEKWEPHKELISIKEVIGEINIKGNFSISIYNPR